jgi:hypothetical protein
MSRSVKCSDKVNICCFGKYFWRSKWTPNLMRLDLLFPPWKVLQLILRNPIELPYEFDETWFINRTTSLPILNPLFETLRSQIKAWSKNKVSFTPLKLQLLLKVKLSPLVQKSRFYLGQSSIMINPIIRVFDQLRHFLDICSTRTLHDFCSWVELELFEQGCKVWLTS